MTEDTREQQELAPSERAKSVESISKQQYVKDTKRPPHSLSTLRLDGEEVLTRILSQATQTSQGKCMIHSSHPALAIQAEPTSGTGLSSVIRWEPMTHSKILITLLATRLLGLQSKGRPTRRKEGMKEAKDGKEGKNGEEGGAAIAEA